MTYPRLEAIPVKAQSAERAAPNAPPSVEHEKQQHIHKKQQNKGLMAGLPSILNNIGPLPIILVLIALNNGGLSNNTSVKTSALPALPPPAPVPPPVEVSLPDKPQTASVRRGSLSHKRRVKKAEPVVIPEPPPPPPPPPPPEPVKKHRRSAPPIDMKNFLGDIAGYLPGSSSTSVAKASKIIGVVDELRSPHTSSLSIMPSANPMDRQMGLLNTLSRNLPFSGAANLGKVSQVMNVVNTLKGGSGLLNNLGNLGNLANMAGMYRSAAQPVEASVMPPQPQNDGIKDTVNKLLGGMDDRQKSELMQKARSFLGN